MTLRIAFVLITTVTVASSHGVDLRWKDRDSVYQYNVTEFGRHDSSETAFDLVSQIIALLDQNDIERLRPLFVKSDLLQRESATWLKTLWTKRTNRSFTHLIVYKRFKIVRELVGESEIGLWFLVEEDGRWKCNLVSDYLSEVEGIERALFDNLLPLTAK